MALRALAEVGSPPLVRNKIAGVVNRRLDGFFRKGVILNLGNDHMPDVNHRFIARLGTAPLHYPGSRSSKQLLSSPTCKV